MIKCVFGDVTNLATIDDSWRDRFVNTVDYHTLQDILLIKRDEFRQQKNFQMADWIRDVLKETGLEVRDTVKVGTE